MARTQSQVSAVVTPQPEGTSTYRAGERERILGLGVMPFIRGHGLDVTIGMGWPRALVNVRNYQVHFGSVDGGVNQIFISPRISDPKLAAAALFEAVADLLSTAKQNKKIREATRAKLGLVDGRPNKALTALFKESVAAMAELPKHHQSVTPPVKDGTRQIKLSCDDVMAHVKASDDPKAGEFILRMSATQIGRVKACNDGKVPCLMCGAPMVIESEVEIPATGQANLPGVAAA